ncbi:MAG: RNA pseudouridine synthase [Verrucomicrobiota bacterium]
MLTPDNFKLTTDIKHTLHNPNFTIIDESDDYIVVHKPAHLLVHPSKPNNPPTLLDGLQQLLAYDLASSNTPLSIINRLDRETSGLVLVAKNPETARRFSLAMQSRQIHKEYLAIVHGHPKENSFSVNQALRRKGEITPSPIWVKQITHPHGQPAHTTFNVLSRFQHPTPANSQAPFALVQALPQTGRMHQIRVHLAHAGHPVVGDKIYGADENAYLEFIETGWTDHLAQKLLFPHQALHSSRLRIDSSDASPSEDWSAPLPPDLQSWIDSPSSSHSP